MALHVHETRGEDDVNTSRTVTLSGQTASRCATLQLDDKLKLMTLSQILKVTHVFISIVCL